MRKNLLLSLLFTVSLFSCANNRPAPAPTPAPSAPQPSYFEHTITFSGETLADIALHYTGRATNWMVIRDVNPGIRPDRLRIGQVLLIPRELLITEKQFTKNSLKRKASSTAAAGPSTAPSTEMPEKAPASVTTEPSPAAVEAAPAQVTEAPAIEVAPTTTVTTVPVVEAVPTTVVTPPAAKEPGDQDREKLLDELLK